MLLIGVRFFDSEQLLLQLEMAQEHVVEAEVELLLPVPAQSIQDRLSLVMIDLAVLLNEPRLLDNGAHEFHQGHALIAVEVDRALLRPLQPDLVLDRESVANFQEVVSFDPEQLQRMLLVRVVEV